MVDGYRIEGLLGEGGMGLVYRGLRPDIGKRVAIKVIQTDQATGQDNRENLLAEARAVNAVRHRGIVDIFAFGQLEDGRSYLVMEELEGETLARALRRGPLAIPMALTYFDQALEALQAAHNAGIVHRDLKPNNLFIVKPPHGDPYMKILDFGLAKRLPILSETGRRVTAPVSTFVGTPYYIAPEQALGQGVGPQTDLYGLGCSLFETLTGRPPFSGATFFALIDLHVHSPAPSLAAELPCVPPALDEVVSRMLRKARKERPESAEEVRTCLARAAVEFHEQAARAKVPVTTGETRLEDVARKDPSVIVEAQAPPAGQRETRLDDTAWVPPPARTDAQTLPTDQLKTGLEDAARKAPSVLIEAQMPVAGQRETRLDDTAWVAPPALADAQTLPTDQLKTGLEDAARKAPTVLVEAQMPVAGQPETRLDDTAWVAPPARADAQTLPTDQLKTGLEEAARKAPTVLVEAQIPVAGQLETRLQEASGELPTVVTSAHVPVAGQPTRLEGRLKRAGVAAAVLAAGFATLVWVVWGGRGPAVVEIDPLSPQRAIDVPALSHVPAKIVGPPTPAPFAPTAPIVPRAVEPRPAFRPLAPAARPVRTPVGRPAPSPQAVLLDQVDDNLEWVRAQQSAGRFDDPLASRLLAAVKEQAMLAKDGAALERASAMLRDWKARFRPGSRPGEKVTKAR